MFSPSSPLRRKGGAEEKKDIVDKTKGKTMDDSEVVDVEKGVSSDEEVYEADVPFTKRIRQRSAAVYYREDSDTDDSFIEETDPEDEEDLTADAKTYRETESPDIVGALVEKTIAKDAGITQNDEAGRPLIGADNDEEDLAYGDSSMDEDTVIDSRNVISQIADDFFAKYKLNRTQVSFPLVELPAEIKKFSNILNDANIDFTTDLPLHLYSVYLLTTRNRNLPPAKFTLWPLPAHELITPRPYLRTTNFDTLGPCANDINRSLEESKYSYVNYDDNTKLMKSSPHMLEFWHPQINPLDELDECIDAIFERKINSQIRQYAQAHSVTKNGLPSKYVYQRRTPDDIHLSQQLKGVILAKLNSIIDKLTDYHTTSLAKTCKMSRKLGTYVDGRKTEKRASAVNYGLDWLSVLSCLDNQDKQSKLLLLRLFNLKLDKDTINGPVHSYPIDNEIYRTTKLRRDKVLKSLVCKSRLAPKSSNSTTQYAKFAKKQKNDIRYNLDSFLNLGLYYTKDKRLKEKSLLTGNDK